MGFQESAIGSQESEVLESTPPEDWMVEERLAAKRAEEKMAAGCDGELFVAKRPRAARQIVVEGAGASEEVKSVVKPVGAERKTRVVRVKQEVIDLLLEQAPFPPYRGIPDEVIDKMNPARRDGVRARQAEAAAAAQKDIDFRMDILEQYHAKGYADIIEEEDPDLEAEYMAELKAGRFG